MDPLIQLLRKKPWVLELFGRIWEILYIEGSTPDIGKRREHVIRVMLQEEFGIKVNQAPPMEREWDFSIIINNKERRYSLKTTENITTVKVAWNGFPSIERARKFQFKYPILYVTGDRKEKEISFYVFEPEDLDELKEELGDDMWWIPKSGTNPRGFGLNSRAVKRLINKATEKSNCIRTKYGPIDVSSMENKYWKNWYNVLKKLALGK